MVNDNAYDFRPATAADLPLLGAWLRKPEVRRWWGDPDHELGLLREDLGNPAMTMLVVYCEGRPIGYMQHYDVRAWPMAYFAHLPQGAQAVDMFIGETDMLGGGHGSAMLRQLALELRTSGVPVVAIDPDPENVRAVKAYEKAGFVIDRPIETEEGPALLMLFTNGDGSPGKE